MNSPVKNIVSAGKIFDVQGDNFTSLATEIFRFQYQHNDVYRQYCDLVAVDIHNVSKLQRIPFLPIRFFKSHPVISTGFNPEIVFESSGTSQTISSKHYVKDISLYETSFNKTFRLFYGDPCNWCIIALLPSYLERNNSSLIMMADKLIHQSGHLQSGFYLDDLEKLQDTLIKLENAGQKTLLIGVTFALLDFAERYPMPLRSTLIMETGGMKGRKKEMPRQQVHEILCNSFCVDHIHSEYGMTELLSQAYSNGQGIFKTPPWLRVLLRDEDDPFSVCTNDSSNMLSGAINIIDLANIYSCSFIATEDAGRLYPDDSFEIIGRLDNTDIRGCSLLTI